MIKLCALSDVSLTPWRTPIDPIPPKWRANGRPGCLPGGRIFHPYCAIKPTALSDDILYFCEAVFSFPTEPSELCPRHTERRFQPSASNRHSSAAQKCKTMEFFHPVRPEIAVFRFILLVIYHLLLYFHTLLTYFTLRLHYLHVIFFVILQICGILLASFECFGHLRHDHKLDPKVFKLQCPL